MRVTVAFRDGTTDRLVNVTAVQELATENGSIAEYTVKQGVSPNQIVTRYPAAAVLYVRSADQEGEDA